MRRASGYLAHHAMTALIWVMSYRSTRRWQALPETPEEKVARYRREQEQAITHYIATHRKDAP